jgi:hypothetical protein
MATNTKNRQSAEELQAELEAVVNATPKPTDAQETPKPTEDEQETGKPSEAEQAEAIRQRIEQSGKRKLPRDVWSRINPFQALVRGEGYRQTAKKVAKAIARAIGFDAKFSHGKPTHARLALDLSARTFQNGLTPVVKGDQVVAYRLNLAFAEGGQVVEGVLPTATGEIAIYELELQNVVFVVRPAEIENTAGEGKRPIIAPTYLAELLCDPEADLRQEVADNLGLK